MKSNWDLEKQVLEYKKTGNKDIKDKLIFDNLYLVESILNRYKKKISISFEELESYGYEGLLLAIDTFDIRKHHIFKNYSFNLIEENINKGIGEIAMGKYGDFYNDYIKVKNEVEDTFNMKIEEEPKLIDLIINILIRNGKLERNSEVIEEFERLILITTFGNLELSDKLIDPIDYTNVVENKVRHDEIVDLVNGLSLENSNVLKSRYGLIDDDCKTVDEISKIYNYSKVKVNNFINKGLEQLENKSKIKSYNE